MSDVQLRGLRIAAGLLSVLLTAPAVGFFDGNKSIRIDDGAEASGQSTVNGSITVGRDANVDGSLETVNGTIRVGEGSRIESASTVNGSVRFASGVTAADVTSVNGSIRIEENSTIDGDVSVVNGKIELGKGSRVAEDVSNVNGEFQIIGAEIGGNLSTVNGDVWLMENTTLKGDLLVEKPGGFRRDRSNRKPKIVIGPGSSVGGDIRLEREVELYISDNATVGDIEGVMSLADAVRFSGPEP